MNRAATLEEYHLENSYLLIRNRLRQDPKIKDRLDKPLAFWALKADRRLPFALLGNALGDILNKDFAELAATPGVGVKKIGALLMLLERASADPVPLPSYAQPTAKPKTVKVPAKGEGKIAFDPNSVSEAVWQVWRKTVKKHQLGYLKLGRLSPTLQAVPTVVWHARLDRYADMSLDEIRKLKTYGDKRVRVVLECFFVVHEMVGHLEPLDHLAITFEPRFARDLSNWLIDATRKTELPNLGEIQKHFAKPISQQLRLDMGDTVGDLVDGRLGFSGDAEPVREQSEELGVTRARIYQLFEDCARAMAVRWPEGRALVREFENRFESLPRRNKAKDIVVKASELIFPEKYEGVDFADEELQATGK